jgi:hypothetical protein
MRLSALMVSSTLLAAPLGAQASNTSAPTLYPGARVRVSTVDAPSVRRPGSVWALVGDTLRILIDGGDSAVAFPYQTIAQLDTSVGRQGHALMGAGIGGLVGVGTGVILGFAGGDDPQGWFALWSHSAKEKARINGIGFGAVGLIVGAVVGANIVTEHWRPIGILPHMTFSPKPSFGVSASLPLELP